MNKGRIKEAAAASSHSRGRRKPLQELNGCSFPRLKPLCFSFLLSTSPTKTPPKSHFDGNPTSTPRQFDQRSSKKQVDASKIPPFTGERSRSGGKKKKQASNTTPVHSSCSSCSVPSRDSDGEEASWVPPKDSKERGKMASSSNFPDARTTPSSRRTIRRKTKEHHHLPDSEKQADVHLVRSLPSKESRKVRCSSDLAVGRTTDYASSSNWSQITAGERKAVGGPSPSSSRFNWSLALNHPWNASLLSSFTRQLDCHGSNREKVASSPDTGDQFSWRRGLLSRMIAMEDELDPFSDEEGFPDLSQSSVQIGGVGLGSIQLEGEEDRVVNLVGCSDPQVGEISGDRWRIICVNPLFKF